jgi:hypothetical protein
MHNRGTCDCVSCDCDPLYLAFGTAQSTIKDAGGVDEGDTSAGCAARLVKKWRKSRSMVLKVVAWNRGCESFCTRCAGIISL